MEVIKTEELITIQGGFKLGLAFGISVAVTFIIGVIDGIVRPLKCN